MIILTADQADQVRGPSTIDPHAALEPVPLKDGTFMLGEQVLTDPAHADHYALLSTLPRVDTIDPSLLPSSEDE